MGYVSFREGINKSTTKTTPGESPMRLEMAFAGRVGIDMKLDDASQGNLGNIFFSLKLTASLPLKIGRWPQIGKYIVFQASIFRNELLVSERVPYDIEGASLGSVFFRS